jgi:hypothetical protein
MPSPAREKLALAEKHLDKVLAAWSEPDWADLAIYGLYCLEAAVEAAASAVGVSVTKQHWRKANVAAELFEGHQLPDVESLMSALNDARKAEAYGDIVAPELDAEDVATEIERYVEAVRALVERTESDEDA